MRVISQQKFQIVTYFTIFYSAFFLKLQIINRVKIRSSFSLISHNVQVNSRKGPDDPAKIMQEAAQLEKKIVSV